MKKPVAYIRDGRAPIPVNEATSRVMSANKGKNTKPELLFRRALWHQGIRGYRLHWKGAPGKPDIAFPGKKTAIFIHGCFWHRCPHCQLSEPKSHTAFWKAKFEKNMQRDKMKTETLKEAGWHVLTFWECQVKEDIDTLVATVKESI